MEVGVGVLAMILGMTLRALAGLELHRVGFNLREAQLVRRPPRIAQEGIYQYLRHPAYTGSLIFIAGVGIACLGWGGASISVAAWPLFRSRMLEEEELLREVRHG